ncbi:hypothetical protein SAY86_011261 [Trapa natans]|uniref:Uncharacterized protein n=1 Tax=Trapa natans TaxID=22666 RepID=A0AAN7R6B1_TRANT|nr:hypothetical protein SAY86_011261 [Trapa natans]
MFVLTFKQFQSQQTPYLSPPFPLFPLASFFPIVVAAMKKSCKEAGNKPPRGQKSREVSSRFLSSSGPVPLHDSGIQSPSIASPPMRKKPLSHSLDSKIALSGSDSYNYERSNSLSYHLGHDQLKDIMERKNNTQNVTSDAVLYLNRHMSCSEIIKFESNCHNKDSSSSSGYSYLKDIQRSNLGRSTRYTEKLIFAGRRSSSAASKYSPTFKSQLLLQGRLSADESALYSKSSSCRRSESDPFPDLFDYESEYSEASSSSASNLSNSTKKLGRVVSSRYMSNLTTRPTRDSLESILGKSMPMDHDSEKTNKFTIKGAIQRADSRTGSGSSKSQWALSPGRTGSPPMSVENKSRPLSFSSMKPLSSPSRQKGMGNFLNLGFSMLKNKKSPPSNLSPAFHSSGVENFHQLRLLHNRLIQWRFTNAKAHVASERITEGVEISLIYAWESLRKLRHSVVLEKLQLEKERLLMKLNYVVHSQMKPLKNWENMERQHSSAISNTTESLLSIICRIPLKDGAEADATSTSYTIRHASGLTSSISMISM